MGSFFVGRIYVEANNSVAPPSVSQSNYFYVIKICDPINFYSSGQTFRNYFKGHVCFD